MISFASGRIPCSWYMTLGRLCNFLWTARPFLDLLPLSLEICSGAAEFLIGQWEGASPET